MKTQFLGRALALAGAAGFLIAGSQRADAALIVLAPSISDVTGSSGTFDVVLLNTGAAAVSIGGFSFGVSTSNPGITFTLATISTASTYIFAGDSLNGPNIDTSTGTALVASDNPFIASSYAVGSGAAAGLGHVSYSISGGAATGTFAITLSPAATSLSDAAGSNIPITALTDGSINVTAAPEPSTLGLAGALALLACVVLKRMSTR
jgi:hypothetical protein